MIVTETDVWFMDDVRYSRFEDGTLGYSCSSYDEEDNAIRLQAGYCCSDGATETFSTIMNAGEAQNLLNQLQIAIDEYYKVTE